MKTNFTKSIIILLMAVSGMMNNSYAAQDSKGTDFWLMFDGNAGSNTTSLFITSDVNTSGMVDIPGLGFSQAFSVVANTVTTVLLPNNCSFHTSDVIDNKGFNVTSLK